MHESIVFCKVYDVVVKKVHVRYLISINDIKPIAVRNDELQSFLLPNNPLVERP